MAERTMWRDSMVLRAAPSRCQRAYRLPSGFPDHEFLVGVNEERQVGILTGRRMDLVADRTRTVNRLRAQLTGTFPGLERARGRA
ncbi:hypothetical protein [Streptomyces sp. NPDC005125]